MSIQPTENSRKRCPRSPADSDARPAQWLGRRTAECQDCGSVLRVCDRPGCEGRNLPGSVYCRRCGEQLTRGWREIYWNKIAPRVVSGSEQPAHVFEVDEDLEKVRLLTSDAWVALALDRRLLVMEPGPALAKVCEIWLEEDEKLMSLRRNDERRWEILTSQRVLTLDPKNRQWQETEAFEEARGELLWESGPLRAYYRLAKGSTLWSREGDRLLLEDGGVVTEPAWLDKERWFCVGVGSRQILHGSISGRKLLSAPALPGPGTLYAPVAENGGDRVFISGREQIWLWKSGNRKLTEVVPAAGGALFASPGRLTLLEGERIRVFKSDLRPIWDSFRDGERAFRRGPYPCEQVGGKILILHEQRGATSTAWLFDPRDPRRRTTITLPGELLAEPRLAAGGIATVHSLVENRKVALFWTEVAEMETA